MTQLPQAPTIQVRPQPTVYTVLLLVAILALLVAIGVVLWRLMSAMPTGYALTVKQLFERVGSPR